MTEETITKLASIADAARALAKAAALNGVKPEDLQALVEEEIEKVAEDLVTLERGPEATMKLYEVRSYLMDIMLPDGKTGEEYWDMQAELYAFYENGDDVFYDVKVPVREVKFIVNKFDPTGKIFRELECNVPFHMPDPA